MIRNINIRNVFIYITEKCNLNCGYCYFRDKRGRTLDFLVIKRFIDFIHQDLFIPPANFMISGGEPLRYWPLLKKSVSYIKHKFNKASIGVQTNGLLLNDDKLAFIKDNRMALEVGIDGAFETTSRHRKGITKKFFNNLVNNINKGVRLGIHVSCTMTVHPDQVDKIYENYIFLAKLGLKDIDITPAAFMHWDNKARGVFKRTYLKIIRDGNFRNLYTQDDSAVYQRLFLDLSLHPPHYVFCGDVYLCLPEDSRKKYSLFDFGEEVNINKKALLFYLKEYGNYFSRLNNRVTYRDYISFGFKIINKITHRNYLNSGTMINFHEFFKKTHLASSQSRPKV